MILILGGGLAGTSTAYHLGEAPHLVLEAAQSAGGLCRTREVDGFLFDYTGHLLHLRDEGITALVDELLPGGFDVIERHVPPDHHSGRYAEATLNQSGIGGTGAINYRAGLGATT